MKTDRYYIEPIGFVETTSYNIKKPSKTTELAQRKIELKEYRRKISSCSCIIKLLPEYEPQLDGIDQFSHIVILFWPHLIKDEERKRIKKVHPRGWKDIPAHGIFATRSPVRPNPVLMTTVKLVKIDGLELTIKGFDGYKGSPVIDIKPDTNNSVKTPDWLDLDK